MPRRLATVHVAPTVTLFHKAATYCGLWIERPVESRLRVIALDGKLGPEYRLCARCRAAMNPTFAVEIGGANVR